MSLASSSLERLVFAVYSIPERFLSVAELRVRYSETDQMGVVYNANHFVWFEIARTEFCRFHGMSYKDWESKGVYLPVVEAHCRYKIPARYDDMLELYCAMPTEYSSRRSVFFEYLLYKKEIERKTLLAEGWTRHAITDESGRLLPKENALKVWLSKIGKATSTQVD